MSSIAPPEPPLPTPPSPTPSPLTSPLALNVLSPEEYVTERLKLARSALLSGSLYLGHPDIRDKLIWINAGNFDILVTKEDASAFKNAQKAATEAAIPPPHPSYAVLSAVVLITDKDFCLTSCGMWQGQNDVVESFADVKLSCIGQAPVQDVFSPDFPHVTANVEAL